MWMRLSDIFLRSYEIPENIGNVLSRYTTDFEQWWRVPRPNINEW